MSKESKQTKDIKNQKKQNIPFAYLLISINTALFLVFIISCFSKKIFWELDYNDKNNFIYLIMVGATSFLFSYLHFLIITCLSCKRVSGKMFYVYIPVIMSIFNSFFILTNFTVLGSMVTMLGTIYPIIELIYKHLGLEDKKNTEQGRMESEYKIEQGRNEIENARRDNETIKDLNERLHEILKNRHSTDENVRTSSYFQLAGLYKNWGLLGENSEIIEAQRKVQQKNILKLIFGTVSQREEQEQKKNARSFLEITTLNSVIADIFPKVSDTDEYKESFEPFDLQYADLSGLNFDGVVFPVGSNLSYADLTSANFSGAHLSGASFQTANLQTANLQAANLQTANLQTANLQAANLQHADLQHADLQHADLQHAKLWGTNLWRAHLQGARLQGAGLQNANLQSVRLQYADLQGANLQGANLHKAEKLTAEQLAQAQNIESIKSIETREWNVLTGEYGKEDQALKNLIQEALEIQKQHKNI